MFALGLPGQAPRIILDFDPQDELRESEVAVPVSCPGDWLISADGSEAIARELTDEELWRDLRARRNAALAACDWTQLPDVPEGTRAAWQAYRQALRDMTDISDPRLAAWPETPE